MTTLTILYGAGDAQTPADLETTSICAFSGTAPEGRTVIAQCAAIRARCDREAAHAGITTTRSPRK